MKNLKAAATPFIPEIVFIINASKILEKSKYKKEVKNDLFFDKLPSWTRTKSVKHGFLAVFKNTLPFLTLLQLIYILVNIINVLKHLSIQILRFIC